MADEPDILKLIRKASWSLKEAAHLVHEINPNTNPVELKGTSDHPVDRTYVWLKKEYGKGRLYAAMGDAENPRFSPGTLMRHMVEKKRFVSAKVRRIYDLAHGKPGAVAFSPEAKKCTRTLRT